MTEAAGLFPSLSLFALIWRMGHSAPGRLCEAHKSVSCWWGQSGKCVLRAPSHPQGRSVRKDSLACQAPPPACTP